MKELIDSLWREYYGLYAEKYNRDPEKWLQNYLSADIDFGLAIGQDHFINSNKSIAMGMGGITTSFLETVLGSYNLSGPDADPSMWNQLDRLIIVGNGVDAENRSNALEVFKSGLFRLFNAIQLSAYQHGGEVPSDGTLQYLDRKLELSFNGVWHELALKSDISGQGTTICQVAHGFIVGDCIKPSGGAWVKVISNSIENAGVSALVCSVTDADTFTYITSGFLQGPYTFGVDYYSSTSLAGALMNLSSPEVWSAGQVRQYIGTGVAGGLMIDLDAGDLIQASAFNDIYITGMSFNNANRVLTLTRSASMPDLTLAIPYPPEDMGYEFRDINKGVAQTYVLDMKAGWAYTILGIVLESDGTLNSVSVKIGSTAVTGLSALAVGAIAEFGASGANAVAAGNVVTINTSASYSGTPTWLRVKLKIQRT
jgi:hypothetical protein